MMNQELINKYREINVDYGDWYEDVYEWFDEKCQDNGITIDTQARRVSENKVVYEKQITWSGFWSQGDGAAFKGYIKGKDVVKALASMMQDYPIFNKYINELNGHFKFWWNFGRGNNVTFEGIDFEELQHYIGEDHPFLEIWEDQLAVEMEKIEVDLMNLVEYMCEELYKTLRDEYDYLTSDEAVWETIVANELDKETYDETT